MARLATTVVIMTDGRVAAVGETSEVMGRMDLFPLTGRHEAGSVLEMTVAGEDTAYGLTILKSPAGEIRVPRLDLPLEAPLRVHIRARDVLIGLKRPEALSALNVLEGRVAEVGPSTGPIVDVRLDLNGALLLARVTRMTVDRLGLKPGLSVFAIIKSIALDRRSVGRARPAATSIGTEEITL
jgi:molybdate transport system ATP-binding protein